MSVEQTRATLVGYPQALVVRGDYGRYLADDATVALMGTDQAARGLLPSALTTSRGTPG
jgi:hypothetical protein